MVKFGTVSFGSLDEGKVAVVVPAPNKAEFGSDNIETVWGEWLDEHVGDRNFHLKNVAPSVLRRVPGWDDYRSDITGMTVQINFRKASDAAKFLEALETKAIVNQTRVARYERTLFLRTLGMSGRKARKEAWKMVEASKRQVQS